MVLSESGLAQARSMFVARYGDDVSDLGASTAFHSDEVEYKLRVHRRAATAMRLEEWTGLCVGDGEISRRTIAALEQSENLVYRVHSNKLYAPWRQSQGAARTELEGLTFRLLCGNGTRAGTGQAVDDLFAYLRATKLGRHWDAIAYLLFVRDPTRFVPIHPGRFDRVMRLLGVDARISNTMRWERYAAVLDVLDLLWIELADLHPQNILDVHGFLYVVGEELEKRKPTGEVPQSIWVRTWEAEWERRMSAAKTREAIGLRGEQIVLEYEKQRLTVAGLPDEAAAVVPVAWGNSGAGYDIRSFLDKGRELHIEVKTTCRDDDSDFVLTENERRLAEKDPDWVVYRVTLCEPMPRIEPLGNGVKDSSCELSAGAWRVASASTR